MISRWFAVRLSLVLYCGSHVAYASIELFFRLRFRTGVVPILGRLSWDSGSLYDSTISLPVTTLLPECQRPRTMPFDCTRVWMLASESSRLFYVSTALIMSFVVILFFFSMEVTLLRLMNSATGDINALDVNTIFKWMTVAGSVSEGLNVYRSNVSLMVYLRGKSTISS